MRISRSKLFRYFAITAAAIPSIVIALFILSGCDKGRTGKPDPSTRAEDVLPRVQTVTVKRQDLLQQIELPGTVMGVETTDLFAKVGGYLEEFAKDPESQKPIDIGDHVKKDQVLARLSIPEMAEELAEKEAAVASAEAFVEQEKASVAEASAQLREKRLQLVLHESEYKRTKDLVDRGSVNAKLLDEATFQRDAAKATIDSVEARIQTADAMVKSASAKVDLAKAERDRIQTMLQYGEIDAPFDGVVTNRYVDRGAFIQPALGNSAAKPLLTITRMDIVRVSIDLPMGEVRWLDRGDKVVLDRINVLPGEKFEGEVTRFAPSLHKMSRLMRVEIDLPNPDQKLLPGYFGYVKVTLDQFSQTPVIPSSALLAEDGKLYVFVVEGDICRKQLITPNYQDGEIVGVSDGLTGGEQVVQAGAGQLADGQKVVAVNTDKGS